MTDAELKVWASEQVEALMEVGVDGFDAQKTVERVLAQLPEGVDPNTWIPLAPMGEVEITEAEINDARADWWANDAVPGKFKRLLDAVEEPTE